MSLPCLPACWSTLSCLVCSKQMYRFWPIIMLSYLGLHVAYPNYVILYGGARNFCAHANSIIENKTWHSITVYTITPKNILHPGKIFPKNRENGGYKMICSLHVTPKNVLHPGKNFPPKKRKWRPKNDMVQMIACFLLCKELSI